MAAGAGCRAGAFTAFSWSVSPASQHELPPSEDPDLLAFELKGICLAADANFVLRDDPAVLDLARQVVRRRLGLRHDGHAARE